MNASEIKGYFESRRHSITDAITEIVNLESPSHDAERSRAVADLIAEHVQQTGAPADVERIAVDDGEHLIIRAFSDLEMPQVLLLGHTDTVHPVGTQDLNPTRVDGDRFYGCGIFDMKSGIVLMLEALRFFAHTATKPHRPITILLSCDEEVGSHSGREFVEREGRKSDLCLVFEPSANGKVKTGRKGTGTFRISARGVPAHAGLEPEKGANAITEIAGQIPALHSLANPDAGTTVNVTTIRGGTTTNVIPEHAVCEVDVRFSSMDEAERIDRAIRSLTSSNARISIEISDGINRPPMERTAAVAELFEKAREIAASLDYNLYETQVGGASDGNFVGALGVPVLDGLGIAGDGAHRLDEHILISDIVPRASFVTTLLRNL